jgi:hypothetical protein
LEALRLVRFRMVLGLIYHIYHCDLAARGGRLAPHRHPVLVVLPPGRMNLSIESIKTHYEKHDIPTNHLRH